MALWKLKKMFASELLFATLSAHFFSSFYCSFEVHFVRQLLLMPSIPWGSLWRYILEGPPAFERGLCDASDDKWFDTINGAQYRSSLPSALGRFAPAQFVPERRPHLTWLAASQALAHHPTPAVGCQVGPILCSLWEWIVRGRIVWGANRPNALQSELDLL
jgi:hypothetical protein